MHRPDLAGRLALLGTPDAISAHLEGTVGLLPMVTPEQLCGIFVEGSGFVRVARRAEAKVDGLMDRTAFWGNLADRLWGRAPRTDLSGVRAAGRRRSARPFHE